MNRRSALLLLGLATAGFAETLLHVDTVAETDQNAPPEAGIRVRANGGFLPTGRLRTITICADFQKAFSPRVLEYLKLEVISVMTPAGLDFRWRSMVECQNEVNPEAVVVRFTGLCQIQDLPEQPIQHGSLARTHITDGQVLSFAEVDCSRVHQYIQSQTKDMPISWRKQKLGRALGRVLAHELFHMITRTRVHAPHLPSHCTPGELLAERFRLDAEAVAQLRATRPTNQAKR